MGRLRIAIMVVVLCVLVYLAAQLMFLPTEAPPVRLEVFEDRFEYRYRAYPSLSALAIALDVSSEPLGVVRIRECGALPRARAVFELVRAHGEYDFEIVVPESC